MESRKLPRNFVISNETPVMPRTALITHIDGNTGEVSITPTGSHITVEPTSMGNMITIDPVNEPSLVICSLKLTIEETLLDRWTFNHQAAQFFATGVQAGLVVKRDHEASVTLDFYNAQAQEVAEYQVSLGFLPSGSDTPVWIDDPTIILKPPTDGGF
jgi:hypothetical protein